jgi:hypothetical protein
LSLDLAERIGTNDPAELARRFEAFKASLDDEWRSTMAGETRLKSGWHLDSNRRIVNEGRLIEKTNGADLFKQFAQDPLIGPIFKGASADVLQSVKQQIDAYRSAQADVMKDITTTSPLGTGLVPFDLEAPSKYIVPTFSPLRNKLPRQSGQGLIRRFKRITGFSGSGTGSAGAAFLHGITETTQNNFNLGGAANLQLIRGPKISYSMDDQSVNYHQFSLSDQISWEAQFAGQGFQDIRQLSQFVLLTAHMIADERVILAARSTDSGSSGALAAPGSVTLTARAAGAGEVGITGAGSGGTNVYVKVTSQGMFGESVLSSVASVNIPSGTTNAIDVKIGTDAQGALGYRIYANKADANGADPGDATRAYQGRTGWNTFTIGAGGQSVLKTAAPFAAAVTADTSASGATCDGMMSIVSDGTRGGYNTRLNAVLSSSNPGVEFQNAFLSLWESTYADPEDLWMAARDSSQLSDLIKTNPSGSSYRISFPANQVNEAMIGAVVTGITNQSSPTRRMVDILVHPYMPGGNAMILSWQLPVPNSQIPSAWEWTAVQDYMSIAWPTMQFTWDVSTYAFGALTPYAPLFSASIQGIRPTYGAAQT